MDFGSPRTDLCALNQGTLSSSFDLVAVALTFSATDQDRSILPPGDYTFVISSFVGALVSADSNFTLKLVDPCSKPDMVSAIWDQQVNPDTYYYRGESRIFTLVKPVITPLFCEVIYTCNMDPGSPRTDLCLIAEEGLSGIFDPDAVTYANSVAGIGLAPPGEYKFIISATLADGGGSVDTGFTLTFVDPCHSMEAEVITRTLTNPPLYILNNNFMEYEIAPLQTVPADCPLTYSC